MTIACLPAVAPIRLAWSGGCLEPACGAGRSSRVSARGRSRHGAGGGQSDEPGPMAADTISGGSSVPRDTVRSPDRARRCGGRSHNERVRVQHAAAARSSPRPRLPSRCRRADRLHA
jgi:hypothetical protein